MELRHGARRHGVARSFACLLALAGALSTAGCVAERERPLPLDVDTEAALSVTVLAPRTGDGPLIAGRDVNVRVYASEPAGRLRGVGAFMRRSFTSEILAEEHAFFAARRDTTATFRLRIPAELAQNTQVDIVGIAYGPQNRRRESVPSVLMVLRCTPGAIWCG